MIYLMENKMSYGRVVGFKVGMTERSLKERSTQYRTHNPWCSCIDTYDGGNADLERTYHEEMNSYPEIFRRVGMTEWFEVVDRRVIKTLEEKGFTGLDDILSDLSRS